MIKELKKKKFLVQLLAVIAVAAALQFIESPVFNNFRLSLAAADELHGYAWSSNIGWVSMNCTDGGVCGSSNYSVSVDSLTGALSGYGWSSNIGWIDFSPPGPYPAAGPNWSAKIDNPGQPSSGFSGWARALSYNVANGEWDGWIRMSGTAVDGRSYSVVVQNGQLSGFAWGGDVVGWLNFNGVTRSGGPPPACPTFSANPNSIVVSRGGSGVTTLSWQCVNVTPGSCSIDQDVGPVPDSGSRQVTLSQTTTYTLSCLGGGGASAQTFVEVRVFLPTREEVRP